MLNNNDVEGILLKVREHTMKKLRARQHNFKGMEYDDVVSEVTVKVFTGLKTYDPNRSKISTFIDHVIENRIKDCYGMSSKADLAVSSLQDGDDDDSQDIIEFIPDETDDYASLSLLLDIENDVNLTSMEKKIIYERLNGREFQEIGFDFGYKKSRFSQIVKGIKTKLLYTLG
jgi:RNA polymerase sporulation-specific sigma factor